MNKIKKYWEDFKSYVISLIWLSVLLYCAMTNNRVGNFFKLVDGKKNQNQQPTTIVQVPLDG